MDYALLTYSKADRGAGKQEMPPGLVAILDRPEVRGWLRLETAEAATTVRSGARGTLLTDGPFVESKEFFGGVIFVTADDLDGALAVAAELQALGITAAIEVRPIFEREPGGG